MNILQPGRIRAFDGISDGSNNTTAPNSAATTNYRHRCDSNSETPS